ncbi:MAG TPA: retroviral-like aspartic protease family protein [Armatimonadota bacterium]|jgi:predicted aspartyl protease
MSRTGTLLGTLFAALTLLSARPALCARAPLASERLIQISTDRDTAYIVPVTIGPLKNLLFLVDTAATRTVITPAVRNAAALKSNEATMEEVAGAGGGISAECFVLPSLAIQGAVQRDLHVVVLQIDSAKTWIGRSLDGILGADYLRNYDVRLDGKSHTLELTEISAHAAVPERANAGYYNRVPFELVGGGFMVLPVSLNGREVMAVLDTGSSRTVLNSRAADLAGLAREAPEAVLTAGVDNVEIRLGRQRLKRMEFAGMTADNEMVSVGNLPIFRQFGLQDRPAAILGARALQNREALISYSAHLLFVERRPDDLPPNPIPEGHRQLQEAH